MVDWDKIEQDIKASEDHWERFMFLSEQIAHAYVNLYVEKFRDWGWPKTAAKVLAYATLITPIPILLGTYAIVKRG